MNPGFGRRAGELYLLVSSAALLAGQVSWSRLASVPIGGSLASGMTTLSAAMAGLGLGAFLAGAWRPRRLPAALVAVSALVLAAMPFLILRLVGLSDSLLLRRALAALLLAAAHLPFGMIFPCIAERAPSPGRLYALSALGATVGALGLSEVLAPLFGFDQIGGLLAAATLLSGIPLCVATPTEAAPTAATEPAPAGSLVLAGLLGFLGLLAESLWLQLFGFYWEANAETFGLVIAVSIGGLTIGSAYGRRLPLRFGLGFAAASLALAALLSTAALQAFTFGERLALAAGLVGLPAMGFGAAFAQLLQRHPRSVARLAGVNAAGAAAAPLLLGLTSTEIGWPARALVGVACGYGLLSGLGNRKLLAGVALGALGAGWLAPAGPPIQSWQAGAVEGKDFEATVLPFVRTGTESTVAVTRDTRSGVDILWIDRGFQGDTSPLGRRIPTTLGKLPCALLGRAPRRALAIGLGTGLTLAGIVDSGATAVEVAELSRGVIEADRTILADANGRVLERPGVTVHHEDGRTRLADAREPYDLIVTDMMFPTVAGAGNLYSREFYALARRRLAEDGLFVHWLPGFLLAPEDLSAIAAAFLQSFPEGTVWIGFLDPHRLILGLAGGRAAGSDRRRLLLGPEGLRALAADAAALRDADPRLEIRSNRRGDVEFGRTNLHRLLEAGASTLSPGWIRCAEAALAEDPDRALALYRQADVDDADFNAQALVYERTLAQARRSGDLALLRRAAANPLYGGANLDLAVAQAEAGLLPEAIAELEAALRKSPRSADAAIRLALLASATGDRVKAHRAFEEALRLRPDRPPILEELAKKLDPPR